MIVVLLAGCGVSSVEDGLGVGPSALSGTSADAGISINSLKSNDSGDVAAAKKTADEVVRRAQLDASGAYRIGAQDVIEVTVFKVKELSKPYEVSEAGTINFPLIGDIQASGKTGREIEQSLARKLGRKYLQNPQVSVRITGMNSQRYTIEGAVKKPGVYPVIGRVTLMQAIAVAQGLDEIAQSEVVLFRHENGKRTAARFDIDAIRSGTTPDPRLRSGDLVIARTSTGQMALKNVMKILPMLSVFTLL